MYFVYVYSVYSFVIYWYPLGVFGTHFVSLGVTLGLISPKGLSLAPFRLPFGSLGTPWDHLGHLGLPSGAWADLGQQWTSNSQQMGLK